jgi:hypothetical protein
MEPVNNSYQPGKDLPVPNNQAGSDADDQNTPVSPPPMPDDQMQTPTPVQSAPAPVPSSVPQDDPVVPQSIDIVPPAAEDSDLIEQEWVDKAKAIVNSNSHDPHTLNKEINKFKADYIKKRYNKEIKVITD